MKLQSFSPRWNLVEFTYANSSAVPGKDPIPMQLFKLAVPKPELESDLWFMSGFSGPSKNDSHVVALLQRAIERSVFNPVGNVYLTPVTNPAGKGLDLNGLSNEESPANGEIHTLLRWAKVLEPKALVTLSVGESLVRYSQAVSPDVVEKLAELTERTTRPAAESDAQAQALAQWCELNDMLWIDFSIDETKKTFEEVKDNEWRRFIGPAMKWLVEGSRFNAPKQEAIVHEHTIIAALELPPEFANL